MNSISIGKIIYNILASDVELKKMVGTNIYPIIAEQSTIYPFIVYQRQSINNQYCKDGHIQDIIIYDVYVTASTYDQSIDIASKVNELLTFNRYEYNECEFRDGRLINITEQFNDAYVQTLTFQVESNYKNNQ